MYTCTSNFLPGGLVPNNNDAYFDISTPKLPYSVLANEPTHQECSFFEQCQLQYAWCRLVFLEKYLKYYIQGCSIGLLHNVA